MSEDRKHIATGGVVLYVNRNANVWSKFTSSMPLHSIEANSDTEAPIETVVVYVIPGFRNPVEFSGTRITIKSTKGPRRVQVEAAIPDMPFPEDNPEEAKKIVLDLMLKAVKEVEAYANKNKLIKGELDGARNVIRQLHEEWDVSGFRYAIPEGLPYYDLPKINGLTTRRFTEKLPDGGVRHYSMVIDEQGEEVA